MLEADPVQKMVARREREGIKGIVRKRGVDHKTVKRWLKLDAWQPRDPQRRARIAIELLEVRVRHPWRRTRP